MYKAVSISDMLFELTDRQIGEKKKRKANMQTAMKHT